jgi:polar amino acid transport system substrate-binding protein
MNRFLTIMLIFAVILAGVASAQAVELPPDLAKRGSITVAIVPNYPPLEFRDPATNALSGFDVELGEALGRKLGIKIVWQETSFDQFMPSIATGRVDAILSGMTDYATRHQTATFVDYLQSGPHFFVQLSRVAEFKDMAALCGKSRRQPPHHVPGRDRRVERGALRQQSDRLHRHGRLG